MIAIIRFDVGQPPGATQRNDVLVACNDRHLTDATPPAAAGERETYLPRT